MKRWKTILLVGAVALVVLLAVPLQALAVSPAVVVDSYSQPDNGSRATGYYAQYSQSFTAAAGTLHSAKMMLAKKGSPTGYMYAYLYAVSGTYGYDSIPAGPPLAVSGPVSPAGLPSYYSNSAAQVEFTFNDSAVLAQGGKYAIVLRYDSGNSYNGVAWSTDWDGIHSGNQAALQGGGTTWEPEIWNPNADFIFSVYEHISGAQKTASIGSGFGDNASDTYIYSYRPTGYFGSSTAVFAGSTSNGEERALLRFPLSKLSGTAVTSATVSLTKSTGAYTGLRLFRLRRPVTNSASWNNYQTGSPWGAAGAKDSGSDYYWQGYADSSTGQFQVGDMLKWAIASGADYLELEIVDPDPQAKDYTGFYSSKCVYAPWRPVLSVEGIQ